MDAITPQLATVATAGIPYRADSAVSADSLASAIFITLLVLGVIIGGALLARRYGWLWFSTGGARGTAKPSVPEWHVTARLRLSATARAYVLENKDGSYLVIESSQHLAVQPHARATREEHVRER